MIASLNDSDELQLNAYCDGELDPAAAMAFERRLAGDASLKARYDRLLSVRGSLRALPQAELPPGLRDRIQSALDAERPNAVKQSPRQRSWPLQAMAAAAVFGAVIASSVMLTFERYDQRAQIAGEVVAGHIRSLMAPQPFDVASSDRHTVKPWFTSRLPVSPQVPDLAAQGFVLLGGRVDVVGHDPRGDDRLQARRAYGQPHHPEARSVRSREGDCGLQRPKLERSGFHLYCGFGPAGCGSCHVRTGIFRWRPGPGSQIAPPVGPVPGTAGVNSR